jgi:hypothetical protein
LEFDSFSKKIGSKKFLKAESQGTVGEKVCEFYSFTKAEIFKKMLCKLKQ